MMALVFIFGFLVGFLSFCIFITVKKDVLGELIINDSAENASERYFVTVTNGNLTQVPKRGFVRLAVKHKNFENAKKSVTNMETKNLNYKERETNE